MTDRNPQAAQMADESMVRTLDAQIRCLWPQEQALFDRYGSPETVLDVGCGTGACTVRLAERYRDAQIVGVELDPTHVRRARERCRPHADRVRIEEGDAFALRQEANSIDLVVCRHVLQAVPEPEQIVAECVRVLRPGGWLHLLLEDYTMLHFEGRPELDRFWHDGPVRYGLATGCDMRIGRRGLALLAGLEEARIDYVTVDTARVRRDDFAAVFRAWRDGYSAVLGTILDRPTEEVRGLWDEMIAVIETGYAVWQVPVASARRTP